eukprot:5358119-Karenia_brevis.AAC.1
MMWRAPEMLRLTCSKHAQFSVCDLCQYGTKWRKRTRLAGWHIESMHRLMKKCSGRGSQCSRTHKPHIILTGQCKHAKILWTSLAQVYPCKFGSALASTLIESFFAFKNLCNTALVYAFSPYEYGTAVHRVTRSALVASHKI